MEDLGKEFPKETEVIGFIGCVAPLLSKAMGLRNKHIPDRIYYKRAKGLKKKIIAAMNSPGRRPGVQKIQDIFREKKQHLFHWAEDRDVPAENNFAEREPRPTVIARKVSHGSQSEAGAKTRSVMMSILHTVKKRLKTGTVEDWLTNALREYIHNPFIDPRKLLPDLPDK